MLVRDGLAGLRVIGIAGSTVLAAGAFQVAALPGQADEDSLPGLAQLPGIISCLVGLVALTAAWWRVGRVTAAPGGPVLTGRWMLVTAALWAIPLLVAPPLASRDVYAYACQGALFQAGGDPHAPASTDPACPWQDSAPPIWRHSASPYGPLFSMLSGAAATVSVGQITVVVGLFRLLALVGVVLATWYGRRLAVECGVSQGRAAWLGLASPLVAVHALSGAHNDALMTGLVIAAFAAAMGHEPDVAAIAGRGVTAGLALGLAVGIKSTAVVALPFIALTLVASGNAGRRLANAAAILIASAAAAFATMTLASGLGLGFLRGLTRTGELAQWTSIPTAVGMSVGYLLRAVGVDGGYDSAIAVSRTVGLLTLTAIVSVAWWRAWRARSDRVRRAIVGAGITFTAVAMLGPVFYPWYALTPIALFAVSILDERVRAWLGAATGVLAFLILPNGAGLAARTKLPGALLVTVAVAVAAVRHRRRGLQARATGRVSSAPVQSRTPNPRPERRPGEDRG